MAAVLAILSEWGYWGEELVGPLFHLDRADIRTEFATPTGKRPVALPPSSDPDYLDPPLGRTVVSAATAQAVLDIEASDRLENPRDLSAWIPHRPYLSSPDYLRGLEAYHDGLGAAYEDLAQFDALLLVGGSGPLLDMANNRRVHDLILGFHRQDKLIVAECYGVACLAFARDWETRRSIIRGKHVTGHPLEYDYVDGTGFVGSDLNIGPPPYPLEFILRDAVGPEGEFHGNVGRRTSVVLDYPFLTARSTASSYRCGEVAVSLLHATPEERHELTSHWSIY